MRRREKKCRSTAASAAILAAALAAVPIAKAADSPPEITWSLSGSTAMRNFTISTGFTVLEAGDPDLTLSNGTYSAGAGGLQLAPSTFTGTNLAGSTGAGVRVEWHEQGSVEGVLELVNDQIGYTGGIGGTPLIATALRDPIPGGNPIRVNRNNITGPGISGGGYTILHSTYNTYDPTVYNTAGTNLQGGQNRVQMAISDVVPLQGFSKSGGTGGISLTPGAAGYGKGNSALSAAVGPGVTDINGTGLASGRQQLVDDDFLNMKTSITDPQTGAAYASGAWNTGGVNNLTTKTVAVTATVFTANPGTGLTQINKGDAQWLQTTGRLQNGLDFNVAQRDVNSGTRNVAALNTGVDPSWAVGEDDAGNGNNDPANGGSAALGTAVQQSAIGQFMKFSGKTAGGGQLRPTVQNNRMAIGPLGMSDAIGAVKNNSNANPLRALAYSNTATDSGANFVQPSASSITDGSYVIWQNEQYVTVRSPDANYADDNAIKGDSGKTAGTNGDVAKLRNNILSSVNVHFPNAATLNDPADQLLAQSFILPQMMLVSKQVDGGATSDVSAAVVNGQTHSSWRSQFLADPNLPGNFNTLAAASVTAGSGSNYGVTSTTSLAGGAAAVPITAQDSSGNNTGAAAAPKGNYLFGNFNQTGVRDLSAIEAAQAAQAALFTAGGAAAVDVNNAGVSNSTKIAGVSSALGSMNAGTGPSKGDLVVLGDFNGDGKFNGLDLYQMARGAAVSDANGSGFTNGTLTATAANFGDKLRGGILRKNAALDFMQANATAQQKMDASVTGTLNDPNAFNKFDVNRDGVVSRRDAQIVDSFVGKDYRSLTDQLSAVVRTDISSAGTAFVNAAGARLDSTDPANAAISRKSFSLVDAELNDNGTITSVTTGAGSDGTGTSDFKLIHDVLIAQGSLKDGDANFDGTINSDDFNILAADFGKPENRYSLGDFNMDGTVNSDDFNLMASNFGLTATLANGTVSAADWAALKADIAAASVPEPSSLIGLAAFVLLKRRRGRNQ